jgi:acetyl-CoA carboxylase carboxyl transferase subunit beta
MSVPTDTPTTATPDWVKCPGCAVLLYGSRLERHLQVCPECGHHHRVGAGERIAQLADPGSFTELGGQIVATDPLNFTDRRPYRDRLGDAASRTGQREAAVFGTAAIGSHPVVLLAMDFRFLGGSMGAAVGEAVARAAEAAYASRRPLVLVCASGGARMQEGAISLLQMAKTSQAIARLHEAGVLTIGVLTDPTYGGVTASFATLGDILIAEPGALVGFAGPRVIEQTIRQELPPGFQTSEFLLRHGLVDRVARREELRPLIARILELHAPAGASTADPPGVEAWRVAPRRPAPQDPWDVVRAARDAGRPTALDYLRTAFDDFVELHGDRRYADDPAVVGGVARIAGRCVVVVAHQKGHDTKELVDRSFGMPHPEGYRKAIRLFRHAERFGMPIVTLIDTPGAYPGVRAEEHGQATAIAEAIMCASRVRVPVVSVVTGEGGSGGALALGTGDRLLMLENAFFSVISPEGCAAILWRTAEAAPTAARALRLTAPDLLDLGIADAIVAEPPGGAQADAGMAAANLRVAVTGALRDLAAVDPESLLAARYERFRWIGTPDEGADLEAVFDLEEGLAA